MIAALITLLCAAICALWYGIALTHAPVGALRSVVKTLATALLLALGAILGAPVLILSGLAFGVIGDWFLSRSHARGFLPGLAAFLVGHGLYLIWAIAAARGAAEWGWLHWLGVLVLGGVCAGLIATLWQRLGAMKAPVLAYALISFGLGTAALALLPVLPLFALGVLAFIASDVILAVQLFGAPRTGSAQRRAASTLWALYWLGQLAIVTGSLAGAEIIGF